MPSFLTTLLFQVRDCSYSLLKSIFYLQIHIKTTEKQKYFYTTHDICMSGSPILQDDKLIVAVTHVLVNDPITGYGVFIENMLDTAE